MSPLHALAEQALAQSYSPYSKFRVGAALRTRSGALYSGCNVECAAYPLSTCAERSAIAAAIRGEGPHLEVVELVVMARDAGGVDQPAPPCGACRQLILEFGATALVHFRDGSGAFTQSSIAALLPAGFALAAD
jgi:cytidine deaminase